jgi:hypothetical protein
MSGPIGLAFATAGALATSATAPPAPAAYEQAISVALPSLDTGRGLDASYERYLPARRMSLSVSAELRESATGDYTGLRIGGGVEARWYWRADRGAWLSRLPAGNMTGWFVGAGGYVATDFTHDDADRRWLGTALQLGAVGRIGYRIAPWRRLAITPSLGLEAHRDIDTSGRLPGLTRGGLAIGLDAGWLF